MDAALRKIIILVGEEGLEPSRSNDHQILSLTRIPIPPLAHPYNNFKLHFAISPSNSVTAAQDI